MFDFHWKPSNFGVMPFLLGIPTYTIMMILAIAAGVGYYWWDIRKTSGKNQGAFEIVAAGLICGTIGSKIPILLETPTFDKFLSAKSIVGGLIGGFIGVVLVKRWLNIKLRLGNIIAPAVALGMAIGRFGCFFNGCCYGIETHANWGVDFGDGLLRYPTQLFEVVFHLPAFIILHYAKANVKQPGILFKLYLIAYFIFRFLIEFIRVNPVFYAGLTIYQIISAMAVVFLGVMIVIRSRRDMLTRPARDPQ